MNILIAAGGVGSRLWPASKKTTPKQLLTFFGDQTLLEQTFGRIQRGFPVNKIFVATQKAYLPFVKKQLPRVPVSHYSLEPEMRDRAGALGLACLIMQHYSNDKFFATVWSDDYIKNERAYYQTLKKAEDYLRSHPETVIAIGAPVTQPHTGFRHIELGIADKTKGFSAVKRFTDKPSQSEAKKYFTSKSFLWNTGYFVCPTEHFLGLYKKYLPEVYGKLMEMKPAIGTKNQQKVIDKIYPTMPKVDFEQILIDHPRELTVLRSGFDWTDVGRWSVIKDIQSKDHENLVKGRVIEHNTKGSLVFNYSKEQIVATLGVENLVIVNTDDAILIANKNDSEQIKKLIEKLKSDKKLHRYL